MSTVQNFKGDALELKMQALANPVFDLTNAALDEFYENGYDSSAFLLMLYDNRRVPFSERVNRDTFIVFIQEALANFPFIGTFDSYLFILKAIFGSDSDIFFQIPDPGKLSIAINGYSEVTYEFIGREVSSGIYSSFNITTTDGDDLVFRAVSGIQTEYELSLLFSEIMPAGITPTISLNFLIKSSWISEESSEFFSMIDNLGNDFIFIELGG